MVSNPLAPPSGAIGGRPFVAGASPVYTQPMYNAPAQAHPVSKTSVPVNMPGVSSPSSSSSSSTGRTIYSLDTINAQLASSTNQSSNSQAFDLMASIRQQQAQCITFPPASSSSLPTPPAVQPVEKQQCEFYDVELINGGRC